MDNTEAPETCPICCSPINKARSWKKYCSPKCRLKAYQIRQLDALLAEIRAAFIERIKQKGLNL
jgi:predicted nucleic acid-binding Zn ribbon protein